MAKLGVGLLIIPQKPWREVEKELTEYNTLYREINGTDAPQPISAGWIFVDASAERAREMAMKYIGGYYRTVLDHYQFAGAHMKNQRGYEYYAKMNEKLAVYGDQKAIEFFADLQVYGTPEQVHDKIMAIHKQTNNSAYVGVFSYAGMPHEEAARNMRLFAKDGDAGAEEVRRRRRHRPLADAARSTLRRGAGRAQTRSPALAIFVLPPPGGRRARRRVVRKTSPVCLKGGWEGGRGGTGRRG